MNNYYENDTLHLVVRDQNVYIEQLLNSLKNLERQDEEQVTYWKNKYHSLLNNLNKNRPESGRKAIETSNKHFNEQFETPIEDTPIDVVEELNEIIRPFGRLGKPRETVGECTRTEFAKIGKTGKNRKTKENMYVGTDANGEKHEFKNGHTMTKYVRGLGYKSKYSAVTGNVATAVKKGIVKYNHRWNIQEK